MRTVIALSVLVFAAASACSAKPDDAGSEGVEMCQKIEDCPETHLTVSVEECGRQFDAELESVPEACVTCMEQITCAGWAEWNAGTVTISELCPACPLTTG